MIQLEEFDKIEISNKNHKELKPIIKKVIKTTKRGIGIKWIELLRNIKPILKLVITILIAELNETIEDFLND